MRQRQLILCGVLSAVGMWLIGSPVGAVEADQAAVEPLPAAPQAAKPPTPEEQIKAQLHGTRWAIEMTPLSASGKAKAHKDTVEFGAGTVASDRLTKAGYLQSNYTLTIGGDGVPVWETMQTKEGEGVAFWRGELHGSAVRGVLSKHPLDGPAEDFSFTGNEAGGKSIALGAQQASDGSGAMASSSQPATAPAPAAQTPKKKRKRGKNQ